MRAYINIRFIEDPDIADIKEQGRRTRIGRVPRGEYTYDGKIRHSDRGYCSPKNKAAVRRYLKHSDRAIEARFNLKAEGIG
jgi:hypothetical protein